MTITLPTTACRRERAARLAHRRTSAAESVACRVPAPRESVENVVRPAPVAMPAPPLEDPSHRRIARNAMRADEMAAQALVFVVESADLRARAAHVLSTVAADGPADLRQIDAIVRAFRSYEPFLGERDRALNAAARRRLAAAARPFRDGRAG